MAAMYGTCEPFNEGIQIAGTFKDGAVSREELNKVLSIRTNVTDDRETLYLNVIGADIAQRRPAKYKRADSE